jgi:superfamily II DNA or RNA helicase
MTELRLTHEQRLDLAQYAEDLRGDFAGTPVPAMPVQIDGWVSKRNLRALVGRPPQSVQLIWAEDDLIEGSCSCEDGLDCIHCLAMAEHLTLGPKATESVSVPGAASLEKRIEQVLQRSLAPDERQYVRVLWNQFQTSTRGGYALGQLFLLSPDGASEHAYHYGQQLLPMPGVPKDAIEFWHVAHRHLALANLSTPAFMDEVAARVPPPAEWVAIWRTEDVERWKQRFRNSRSRSDGGRPKDRLAEIPRRIRCVYSPEGLSVEWALPGSEEWTDFKRTALQKTFGREDGRAFPIAPDCELLAEIIRRYGELGRHRYGVRDELLDSEAIVLAILQRPSLHPFLFTTKDKPYRFEEKCLIWHVAECTEPSPDYEIELRMPDGERLPKGCWILRDLDTEISYLFTDHAVWKLPPVPQALAESGSNRIPREALADEAGLQLLVGIKARLPGSLEQLIERVPAQLAYRFDEPAAGQGDSGSSASEVARLRAEVCDPAGKTLMKWSNGHWEPVRKSQARDGRVRIIECDNLPDPAELASGLGAKLDTGHLAVRLTRNFPDKFAAWAKSLPEGTRLDLPPLLQSILDDPVTATVSLTCEQAGVDWFDLSLEITPDNTELSPEELRLLLAAKGGYVRMGARGWMRARFNLSEEDAAQLSALGLDPAEASAEPQRLHTLHLASAASRKLLPPEHEELVVRRQSELKTSVQPAVPADLCASLRPYQVDGFHFLAYLVENGFGGVLADDMGLGKTVQTLAWIAWLRTRTADPGSGGVVPKRVLIVCPKSVAPNWKAEAGRFLPELRLAVWAGQADSEFAEVLGNTDALVLNFAQLRVLEEHLVRQEWLAVILDEAQAIKNPDSQTAKVARSLNARHRVALTGTPIENRLLDLWSIFAFAMPGVLGTRAKFQRGFGKMGDALARQRLATRVRPFLLRRTKGQVAQDLPPRIEEDVICELEGVQRDLYRAEYKKARALLLGAATTEKFNDLKFHFLSSLTRLRQICCHPALVDAAQRTQPAAKVEALVDLLEPLIEEGNKVLVFSQFASMLELLREEVRERKWTEFFLTGQTEDRGPLVDSFNAHPGAAVFLISLKAGGFGLNLTSASYVVLFDPWWNPAVEAQAIDRTHRIGQTQTVIAYRLIVKGSIEEKIRELQKAKSMMAGDTLGEDRFNQALTLDDFRFLFDSAEAAL